MKPMRVLMVVRLFYPWVGGTERQALKLAQQLMAKGVSVEIVTGWWFRGTPQREVVGGIPVFRNQTLWEMFGIQGLRKFGGYLYILSLIFYLWRRRADYDIIHVHGLNYHTFAAVLAGRSLGRKTITKVANSGRASDILKMRAGQQLALSRYMLPQALNSDCFVALTGTIAAELTSAGVPPARIVALVNGVESEQIIAKSDYALHRPPKLIYVGRLHEQKGLDVLLKAVRQLMQYDPAYEVCLDIVGDGPLWDPLCNLAKQLGIRCQVQFLGQIEQVLEHLYEADIFVLPSRAEGLSNALLEAMACGLPVVVSDVPGNVDVVTNGENGLLFTADSPDSLAQSLVVLLSQPQLRQNMGTTAQQHVTERYSMSSVADRYIALYQDLVSWER
jgi:L-malate glycosyltransferase